MTPSRGTYECARLKHFFRVAEDRSLADAEDGTAYDAHVDTALHGDRAQVSRSRRQAAPSSARSWATYTRRNATRSSARLRAVSVWRRAGMASSFLKT